MVTHRVACALMMTYPRALTLAGADQVKAAQRFREWLSSNSQCITLTAKGNRFYELTLDEAAYGALMPLDQEVPDLDAATLQDFEDLTRTP